MARTGKREKGDAGSSPSLNDVGAWIRLMDENHLVEIEIETKGSKIRLVKDRGRSQNAAAPASLDSAPPAAIAAAPPAASTADNGKPIISPMVGTFFRAPSPDAPAFVDVGSIVERGDTVCIIEAMKMMNEIEAEFRGRVARVVAENGQTVEYGESLFFIEPL